MSMYRLVLVTSIFLIVAGILLTAFSLFSPLWQVAVIPDMHVTHQHGLWWDCVLSDGSLIPLSKVNEQRETDKCVNKFDPSAEMALRAALEKGDAVSREQLLHRFLPHHKAVVFFSVFTFLFGFIGIIIGACSPCFPPNSLLYVVSIFMTCSCSVMADVTFLFAANKPENRGSTVDIPPLGIYANELGTASYIHLLASFIFILALVLSVVSSYLLISSKEGREGCCMRKKDYYEQRQSHRYEREYTLSMKPSSQAWQLAKLEESEDYYMTSSVHSAHLNNAPPSQAFFETFHSTALW